MCLGLTCNRESEKIEHNMRLTVLEISFSYGSNKTHSFKYLKTLTLQYIFFPWNYSAQLSFLDPEIRFTIVHTCPGQVVSLNCDPNCLRY